jgi:ubiquinone/menaquinone biosynthesis C-methylase UbiE
VGWPSVRPVSLPSVRRPDDLDTVRESYDRVADTYVETIAATELGDLRKQPWRRAVMDAFADAVTGVGPVLDVGCGPGAVTAYLADRGVDVSGVDLSPRMIECARRLHPHGTFSVSSATELDLADSSLGGVMAWWSLFNLPRDVLPQVLSSFARALMPGGHLIMGTHVGDEDVARTQAYGGIPVRWTTHQWQPEQLVSFIEQAGLELVVELRLPPWGQIGPGVILVARRAR